MPSLPATEATSSSSGHTRLRRNSLEFFKHLQEKYILHPYWNNGSRGKIEEANQIADVDIGEAGCFKYVLIEVSQRGITSDRSKFIVRGDASCTSHAEVFERFLDEIDQEKLDVQCRGGGRICVDPGTRTISINGCSQDFGQANHERTAEMLHKKYRQWTIQITDNDY